MIPQENNDPKPREMSEEEWRLREKLLQASVISSLPEETVKEMNNRQLLTKAFNAMSGFSEGDIAKLSDADLSKQYKKLSGIKSKEDEYSTDSVILCLVPFLSGMLFAGLGTSLFRTSPDAAGVGLVMGFAVGFLGAVCEHRTIKQGFKKDRQVAMKQTHDLIVAAKGPSAP